MDVKKHADTIWMWVINYYKRYGITITQNEVAIFLHGYESLCYRITGNPKNEHYAMPLPSQTKREISRKRPRVGGRFIPNSDKKHCM